MKQKKTGILINFYYIVLSLACIGILAALVLYLPNMREIDYNIIRYVQGSLSSFPISIAKFISYYGCQDYWILPRITAASVLVSHKYYLKAFIFLLFTRLVFVVNDLWLKPIFCRERPCGPSFPGFSFPSGHAAFSTCMFGILIYLTYRYVHTKWWRILLITIFSTWIILSFIARMWLNVHFLTDILAGFFVGLIMVNLFIILDKIFNQ